MLNILNVFFLNYLKYRSNCFILAKLYKQHLRIVKNYDSLNYRVFSLHIWPSLHNFWKVQVWKLKAS